MQNPEGTYSHCKAKQPYSQLKTRFNLLRKKKIVNCQCATDPQMPSGSSKHCLLTVDFQFFGIALPCHNFEKCHDNDDAVKLVRNCLKHCNAKKL